MKEYIEREKAVEEIKKYVIDTYDTDLDDYEHWDNGVVKYILEGLYEAVARLDEVPTADVVEVVRCKDCDFATKNPYVNGQYICEKTRHNSRTGELVGKILVIDTDFCNYGIRKTN